MIIDVLTIFPNMFVGPFTESIIKRAQENKIVQINIHDLRDYTRDKHRITDDYSYGGGAGMIMKPEPIFRGIKKIISTRTKKISKKDIRIILMSPQGGVFNQKKAKEFRKSKCLIFICGHYRGVDERVKKLITDEVSIGDYVLTGGELPAMVLVDAIVRLLPKVVNSRESIKKDSFYGRFFDYPHYTRPSVFEKSKVPEVLLSGNQKEIDKWRTREAIKNTLNSRPDILKKVKLSKEEKEILVQIIAQPGKISKKTKI